MARKVLRGAGLTRRGARRWFDATMKNPGTAGVLSFFIPGLGQLYNGHFWRFLFWLILTPGLWIGTGGLLGWVCHIASAYTAYSKARELSASSTGLTHSGAL